jgi:hypothetical protein
MSNKFVTQRRSLAALISVFLFFLSALAPRIASSAVSNPDESAATKMSDMRPFPNPSGYAATFSTTGFIDLANPFFQSLGTNGRRCSSCHQQSDGWTVNPPSLRRRFEETRGLDPIFRLNDGANSPDADVSTVTARREAYSMLLNKGLIRVGIGIPNGAEFELIEVDDPYGFASAKELSLFRRPLPSTNVAFLSTVMWDGRETFKDPTSHDCVVGTSNCFASIHFDLADQSNAATLGHAQAAQPLTQAQREAIVAFESGLFTAQIFDRDAKQLIAKGALGGPYYLGREQFYFGINDVVSGDYRTRAPFDPNVFTLYRAWEDEHKRRDANDEHSVVAARLAVARGEKLFNTKPIVITDVKGLNDDLQVKSLSGSCTACHDTPNSGNHSIPAPLDIGLTDATRRAPDMPLYTLRNKTTQEIIQTTDPGRALISGRWRDIGRFKGPILRALATRAPYFHNGFAKDLEAVVDFYNERFSIGFTAEEKADLVAFLKTL